MAPKKRNASDSQATPSTPALRAKPPVTRTQTRRPRRSSANYSVSPSPTPATGKRKKRAEASASPTPKRRNTRSSASKEAKDKEEAASEEEEDSKEEAKPGESGEEKSQAADGDDKDGKGKVTESSSPSKKGEAREAEEKEAHDKATSGQSGEATIEVADGDYRNGDEKSGEGKSEAADEDDKKEDGNATDAEDNKATEEAAVGVYSKGKTMLAGGSSNAKSCREIIIEHGYHSRLFTQNSDTVKKGLEDIVPDISVVINPVEPRDGSFEIQENGGETFLSPLILQNYVDILQRNQFQFQDKTKLKIALSGLMRCLSLLPSKGKESKDASEKRILHSFEPDLPKNPLGDLQLVGKLKELLPVLLNCFDEFISPVHSQPVVDLQSFDCLLSLLQCIDLVVQFFAFGIDNLKKKRQASTPFLVASDGSVKARDNSTLFLKKLFAVFPLTPTHHFSDKDDDRYFILNVVISSIFLNLIEWVFPPPALFERFLDFIEDALRGKNVGGKRPAKIQNEKHLLQLLPFIPKLVSAVDYSWRDRLLQAFTTSFKGCSPESEIKIAYVYALEEMLLCERTGLNLDVRDGDPLIVSIEELPQLLVSLGYANPRCSKVVLHLLLRLGQRGPTNPSIERAVHNLQLPLREFYSVLANDGNILYGPFINLPIDCQIISICGLYYFFRLQRPLIGAVASCCLYRNLEPEVIDRIIEVLQFAYTAGHINIEDILSFFITLLSKIEVFPESINLAMENEAKFSNRETFVSATTSICLFLRQMGDPSLLFQMLEKVVHDLISMKLPLDNKCALLRMLAIVDSRPTLLSEQRFSSLSNILLGYMIDIAICFYGEANGSGTFSDMQASRYYHLPCFFLLVGSCRLLKLTLRHLGSLAENDAVPPLAHHYGRVSDDHLKRIETIVCVFCMMCKDAKLSRALVLCKGEIDYILQKVLSLQSAEEGNMSIVRRHKTQAAIERLRITIDAVSARNS